MKKVLKCLNLLAVATFSVSALSAQTIEILGGKSQDFYPQATKPFDCQIYLKNKDSKPLRIAYEKVLVDYPSGWGSPAFCDNVGCYLTFVDSGKFSDIAPGEKASIKISISAQGVADTATIKYAVWDVNTPSVRDTLTFNVMVRWSAGAHLTCMPQQAIYPVPADQQLQVNTLGVDYIEILSLSGQKVMQYYPNADWSRLDIALLNQGSYVIVLRGNNIHRKYTFLKK